MKKLNSALSALLLFMVWSCTKETNQNTETYQSPQTKKNLAQIQDKSSDQEAKLIFGSLTSEEKANVWKCHLQECKATMNLNAIQIQYVDELMDFITPQLYAEQNPSKIAKFDAEIRKAEVKFKQEFNENQRLRLLNDLNGGGGDASPNGTGACRCSQISDWCGGTDHLVFKYCKNIACTRVKRNCGTLFWYDCSGLCYVSGGRLGK